MKFLQSNGVTEYEDEYKKLVWERKLPGKSEPVLIIEKDSEKSYVCEKMEGEPRMLAEFVRDICGLVKAVYATVDVQIVGVSKIKFGSKLLFVAAKDNKGEDKSISCGWSEDMTSITLRAVGYPEISKNVKDYYKQFVDLGWELSKLSMYTDSDASSIIRIVPVGDLLGLYKSYSIGYTCVYKGYAGVLESRKDTQKTLRLAYFFE